VENCTITNNYNGISYDNFSSGYVKNSTISYCYGGCGINCSQYSDPTLKPYNRIWNNTPSGVYGNYNSIPELGTTYNHGNNSIKNNYPDEVWSDNSNTVYAQYNYWGSSSPDPSVSENVVWEPYLTSDPTGGGLLKPFADDLDVNDPFTHTVNDTIGKSQFDKAYHVYLSGDYSTALGSFEQLMDKYPDSHNGMQALSFIDHCYQNLDNSTTSLIYLNQIADGYANKEICGLAKSIAVGYLVKSGEYDAAITNSQQILTTFVDKNIAKYALYDLGTIYWYFKEDCANGEKYYRQLIAAYPNDDLSLSALATLGEWKPGEPNPQPPVTMTQAKVKDFSLDQNYPNPFNPETTIRYHLAEASHVTIKIYNLLGEEVISLVDESQLQGNHAIQWNGRDRFGNIVANGVYWVRMQAGKFVGQRKLVVVR
jgi:tetratricopeptide (TPR) repeat protein